MVLDLGFSSSSQSLIIPLIKFIESETCQVSDAPQNYSNPPCQQQKYAPKDVLLKKIALLLHLVCDLKYEVKYAVCVCIIATVIAFVFLS